MASSISMKLNVACDGYGCTALLSVEVAKDRKVAKLLKKLQRLEEGQTLKHNDWLLSEVRDLCPKCWSKRGDIERAYPRCAGKRLVPMGKNVRGMKVCPGCLDCVQLDKPASKKRKPDLTRTTHKDEDATEDVLTPHAHLTDTDATAPIPTRKQAPKLKPRRRR